ncbi:MAG: gephyrin-like molybdotransferase Glp [Planctomycetota bacterium]
MISIQEALELIDSHVGKLPVETIPLSRCVGRLLENDIVADVDSPPHDKSVMDGFAVMSADFNQRVQNGQKDFSIAETVIAGDAPGINLEPGMVARVMTGAPIPSNADAVIMVENAEVQPTKNFETVRFSNESIDSEKHILRQGSNFTKGSLIFQAGWKVRPTDIGLLAEIGASEIVVGGQPSVSILPTGNELVDCNQKPEPGQIRNSNGPMLVAMSENLGLETIALGHASDDITVLQRKIRQGLKSNLMILSGGVSAGKMDLVPKVLDDLGVEKVFHRVAVKPGKPVWFGVAEKNGGQTVVFGLPGNPVSSLVGFEIFVKAAILKMTTGNIPPPSPLTCFLTQSHETRGNRPTYWPGRLKLDLSGQRLVTPLSWQGSSDLMALGRADGLIFFDTQSKTFEQGSLVPFFPF